MRFLMSIFVVFILALFATLALAGAHTTMITNGHGNMLPCPLMNNTGSLCQMSIMQHLAAWQSLFIAIIPNVIILFLVLTLFSISFLYKQLGNVSIERARLLSLKNCNTVSLFFDPLRVAFSKGILHSKRYNFVSIP